MKPSSLGVVEHKHSCSKSSDRKKTDVLPRQHASAVWCRGGASMGGKSGGRGGIGPLTPNILFLVSHLAPFGFKNRDALLTRYRLFQ